MKPILFNTEMVKAILEGRKTVTRRVIKPKYRDDEHGWTVCINSYTHLVDDVAYTDGEGACTRSMKPPYQVGDILYVRETWIESAFGYVYRASDYSTIEEWAGEEIKWKPSIFMPKEAARIFLEVTNVRAEKLLEMSADDAIKEGCRPVLGESAWSARDNFEELWDSTVSGKDYEKYKWSSNPWVWVIEFKKIQTMMDDLKDFLKYDK